MSDKKTGVTGLQIDWDNAGEAHAEITVVRSESPFLRIAPSDDLPADFRDALLRWLGLSMRVDYSRIDPGASS